MRLVKYEAARRALAEARSVDEVKNIRDKAIAMTQYAKLAKDHDLELMAKEIRLRAERRAGEMLAEIPDVHKPGPGRSKTESTRVHLVSEVPTLQELGVTKKQSSAWQQLAKVPEPIFEQAVKGGKNPLHCVITTKHPKPNARGGKTPKQWADLAEAWEEEAGMPLEEFKKRGREARLELQEHAARVSAASRKFAEAAMPTYLGLDTYTDIALEIVTSGFRHLSIERHPDKGGDSEAFVALKKARDWLVRLIKNPITFSTQEGKN